MGRGAGAGFRRKFEQEWVRIENTSLMLLSDGTYVERHYTEEYPSFERLHTKSYYYNPSERRWRVTYMPRRTDYELIEEYEEITESMVYPIVLSKFYEMFPNG